MIKKKKSIEKWAKEIVRCELILQDVHSSLKEVGQATWKQEAIVNLFSHEPDLLFELLSAVEEKMFLEQFDKNK
jgi:hypothetical protein